MCSDCCIFNVCTHTYFRPITGNDQLCIYYCMTEILCKCVNLMHQTSFTSMVAPMSVFSQCFLLILALVFVFTLHTLYRALKCLTCGKIDNTMQLLHLTISVCVTAPNHNLSILCIESSTFNMI